VIGFPTRFSFLPSAKRVVPVMEGAPDESVAAIRFRSRSCVFATQGDARRIPVSAGEQLLIGPLVDQLKVSLAPVRETLIRLRTEGLLDNAPRRGFFAKALTIS
jgi:hypothetical protein